MTAGLLYPAACHVSLSRRRFLIGGGALLAVGAAGGGVARASDPELAIIHRYATAADDPWAVAHGVRAMGRDFTIQGGRRAVDYLLARWVEPMPASGQTVLGFPRDVEVHPDMFLSEALLEAGVGVEHAFTYQGRRRTVQDLVDGARARFRPNVVESDANLLPWTVIALARTTRPQRGRWNNAWGETVDLDAVIEQMLRTLEAASRPLADAMAAGLAEAVPAPVHRLTCAGTHMLYSLLTAVAAGYVGRDRAERVQRQVDLLVWRLRAEVALIDRFYRERAGGDDAYLYRLDATLKLLGHAEECLGFGTRHGVVTLTADQEKERRAASARLRPLVADLQSRNRDEVKPRDPNLFSQLVGDTCHARHGLAMV